MRTIAALAALAALLTGAACRDATGPSPDAMLGRWRTEPVALQPQGRLQYFLAFGSDHRFVFEWRMHGLYAEQPAEALSAYGRTTGTYELVEERLTLAAHTIANWDSFHGADSPEVVRTLDPVDRLMDPGPYDDARVSLGIGGRTLTLRYRGIGPADEPVDATARFVRDR